MGDTPKEILKRTTYDALMKATTDKVKRASANPEIIKGTAAGPDGWLHGPAHLELLATSDKRLTRVGQLAGIQDKKIQRVQAELIDGTRLLVLHAARSTDMSALEVNRYKGASSAWVNLIDLLAEAGLTAETGWKERYKVNYVPEGSALWPGLVIDLGDPLERKREPVRKKSSAKKSDDEQKGPNGKGDGSKDVPEEPDDSEADENLAGTEPEGEPTTEQ